MVLRPVVARRAGAIVVLSAFPLAAAREGAVAAKNDPKRKSRRKQAGGKKKQECPKCNHPIYTGGFLLQPNLDFGIWAGVTWDGGDTCQVVEFIAYDPIPNPPFQQPNGADLNENGPQYRVPHIPDDVTPIAGANGEAQDKHEVRADWCNRPRPPAARSP